MLRTVPSLWGDGGTAESETAPLDSRLWAALQDVSGGPWGGCVFDTEAILQVIAAGKKALMQP